jgi:hypothetical protein
MATDFQAVFAQLKPVLGTVARRLAVKVDTPIEYTLVSKSASPFPRHKGQPLYFASVRLGKAYVSFHLMPLYMHPALTKTISPALKKRMQGKTCFNFKLEPAPEALSELRRLTETGFKHWVEKKWLSGHPATAAHHQGPRTSRQPPSSDRRSYTAGRR